MPQAPALVVMAAGLGSRYGGLKQMDSISPEGEVLLDFSVYDALMAGFQKIVLVIKHELEDEFEERVGKRLRRCVDIQYAFQDINDLPQGFKVPEGRRKPWGTSHAVRAARHLITEPFAVINADDFYGADAFRVMHSFLTTPKNPLEPSSFSMVGYRLGNTLTDYGSVARGVCRVEGDYLAEIHERTKIIKKEGGAAFSEDGGFSWHPLSLDTTVSMQFFGFSPEFFTLNEKYFSRFLEASSADPLQSECYLPWVVGQIVDAGDATVKILHSEDRWFGVTYPEDKPMVEKSIEKLRWEGVYPPGLWASPVGGYNS